MLDLESMMPADTPKYMFPAWLGCLSWAIGSQEIVAAFRADTGNQWRPAATPIDRMVDDATGAHDRFITAFVEWMNREVWGPIELPSEPGAVARSVANRVEPTPRD